MLDEFAAAVERGRAEVAAVNEWWQARVAQRTPEDEIRLLEHRHDLGLLGDHERTQ
jgi:hypothetical protein